MPVRTISNGTDALVRPLTVGYGEMYRLIGASKAPDEHQAPSMFRPVSRREKARLWIGIAVGFFALAVSSASASSTPSSVGRWGWLHRIFNNQLGVSGDAVLYSFIGAGALAYGLFMLLRKET